MNTCLIQLCETFRTCRLFMWPCRDRQSQTGRALMLLYPLLLSSQVCEIVTYTYLYIYLVMKSFWSQVYEIITYIYIYLVMWFFAFQPPSVKCVPLYILHLFCLYFYIILIAHSFIVTTSPIHFSYFLMFMNSNLTSLSYTIIWVPCFV